MNRLFHSFARPFLPFAFCLLPSFFFAQTIERQTIGSAGFETKIPELTMSATVGQTASAVFSIGSFTLTQGFQQPDDSTSVGTETLTQIRIDYSVWPNPTSGLFTVKIWLDQPAELGLQLHNAAGQLLRELTKTAPLPVGETAHEFKIDDLPAGSYWLELMEKSGRSARTLAILKQ